MRFNLVTSLKGALSAALLLGVAACVTTPAPPPPPPPSLLVPPATPESMALWEGKVGENTRAAEAAEIAKYPNLAYRAGTTLYIFRNGQVVARRDSDPQNCGGFATCLVWFFSGAVKLAGPSGLEDFARLNVIDGEGWQYAIVNAQGEDVWIGGGRGLASPDGLSIASGDDDLDEMSDTNRLSLIDWKGNIPPVVFGPSCAPLEWSGNQSFTVRCASFDVPYAFLGTVRRGTGGLWSLTETQHIDPQTRAPLRDGLPLKVWQGEVLPPPPPPQ